jgi:hypothetical protein
MSTKSEVHAHGPNEHTLCGLAFDAYESGDTDAEPEYAERGRPVTCDLCLQLIEHVYCAFTRTGRFRSA